MWENELKDFLKTIKEYDISYQKVLLKEWLIKKVLEYLYTHPVYSASIFTGGTCLRILYNISRLSEDIDIDIMDIKNFIANEFAKDIQTYCRMTGGFADVIVSTKSGGKSFIIKFPILKKLGLANNNTSESDYLYVKIDTSCSSNPYFDIKVSPYIIGGYNFFIKHYDLPSLFASKLSAIFGRDVKLFYNQYKFKGRDFFDMIWFLQNNVQPNFKRLKYELHSLGMEIASFKDFLLLLDKKIASINTEGIYEDLVGLVGNNFSARQFADHFVEMYKDLSRRLLVDIRGENLVSVR